MPVDDTRLTRPAAGRRGGLDEATTARDGDDAAWTEAATATPADDEDAAATRTRIGAPLLEVEELTIGFGAPELGRAPVVDRASFEIRRGEIVAVVGESGSGKTLSCRAALGILPPGGRIWSGAMRFHGLGVGRRKRLGRGGREDMVDLADIPERRMRRIRGDRIAMIFQEPMSALSPLHTIGAQTMEALQLHRPGSSVTMRARCLETYERVGFPDPERAFRSYPFELSGGMRQRAMIAMAMVVEPELLIADEPTTALDVTTQAQVLDLIQKLQAETGMGVALVTHDLGVVAAVAHQVVVMRKGRVVERGPASDVIASPGHGYTLKLLAAAPKPPDAYPPQPDVEDPILRVDNLRKTYTARRRLWGKRRQVAALRGVDLIAPRGRTLAIVGESGSGKSTVARIALGAERPDPGGRVEFRLEPGADPIDPVDLTGAALRRFRRAAQIVMQDPFAALSPRLTVREILSEPFEIHGVGSGAERREWAADLLEQVGLDPVMIERYPHAFSGGQRQRISIARALALEPRLLVCDEPTSALDVSVQAQILELLRRIRDERGLSYIFISHDLAVVANLADTVAVMRQGRVVESGPPEAVFETPAHPYTKALIAASPEPDPATRMDLSVVAAGAGAPESWGEAFGFSGDDAPPLVDIAPGHWVRKRV